VSAPNSFAVSTVRIERILARADAAITDGAAVDPDIQVLLRQALAPASQAARAYEGWPPLYLPVLVGDALGVRAEQVDTLTAACILFFASADVIDDAQDEQLPSDAWPSWKSAVSGGLTLLFLAHQLALAAAPEERRGAVAATFGGTSLFMSLGQHQDLAQQGGLRALPSEADYLACVRGKTGASVAMFAALPAVVAGADPSLVTALRSWGESLRSALQVSSDLADTLTVESRDRRAGRATLVVQRAWSRLAPADRAHLEAAWRGDAQAPPLEFLLQRTGAVAYVRARAGALKLEAREALQEPYVPTALAEVLNHWVDRVGRDEQVL
jgi:geranylgeranyl pyrophosphate synthase